MQGSGLGDDWQFGGSFSKIIGRHTIKAGVESQTNNFSSPIAYSNGGPGKSDPGLGQAAAEEIAGRPCCLVFLVRRLSKHPRGGRGGCIDGIYVQDQFKATQNLPSMSDSATTSCGLQSTGPANGWNFYTGNANPLTGKYELNALPPNCSATQGAPCIPAGIYTASSTPCAGTASSERLCQPASPRGQELAGRLGIRLGLAYRLEGQDGDPRSVQPLLRRVGRHHPVVTEFRR